MTWAQDQDDALAELLDPPFKGGMFPTQEEAFWGGPNPWKDNPPTAGLRSFIVNNIDLANSMFTPDPDDLERGVLDEPFPVKFHSVDWFKEHYPGPIWGPLADLIMVDDLVVSSEPKQGRMSNLRVIGIEMEDG